MAMNDTARAAKRQAVLHFSIAGVVIAVVAIALAMAMRKPADPARHHPSYVVIYTVSFVPAQGVAEVVIAVTPRDGRVSELRLAMPENRYDRIEGDGKLVREGDSMVWRPETDRPQQLRYRYRINAQRASGGYDAMMTPDWAIVRADDLIPPAAIRATKDSEASARLVFRLPEGWAAVDTPYGRSKVANTFVVASAGRGFDRPMGWVVAGRVGARREQVGKTQIAVAGPFGEDLRRMDTLAFLNLLMPEFRSAFGDLPPKLLVVMAADPMWRGGLSGPRSLFLHAGRPLISENGTSTLTHEMTHVVTRVRGAPGVDWIAEGLAEYYSIELNRRAGLLTDKRAATALAWMTEHGKTVQTLGAAQSRRERTARAVVVFSQLDAEIRKASDGRASLDTVVRDLMQHPTVSLRDLRQAAARAKGSASKVLNSPLFN